MTRTTSLTLLAHTGTATAIRESRRLLEQDIGLDVVEQALILRCGADDPAKPPSKFARLLAAMQDPERGITGTDEQRTISELMHESHCTIIDLLLILAERHKALAIAKSARKMEKILDDIAEDSETRVVKCQNCNDGKVLNADGTIAECFTCGGVGRLRRIGDLESRKLYFKAHGLGEGARGPQVVVNTSAQAGVKMGKDDEEPSIIKRVQGYIDG